MTFQILLLLNCACSCGNYTSFFNQEQSIIKCLFILHSDSDKGSSDNEEADNEDSGKEDGGMDDDEWNSLQADIEKPEAILEAKSKESHPVHSPYFPLVRSLGITFNLYCY